MENDKQVQIETEQLLALRSNQHISQKVLMRAYELAFPEPSKAEWQRFLVGVFYTLGGALVVCGLLFLTDHFWADLSYPQRCGLFGVSTLLSAAAAWRLGRHATSGKVAMTCTSLLLGGLLVVASRVYDTGDWYLILSIWCLLILPYCLLAEFAPLWLFATALFNVTLYALCREFLDPWFFQFHYFEIAVLLLNLALLAAWEIGFWQGRTWMGRRWFPPLLTMVALGPLILAAAALALGWNGELSQLYPLVPGVLVSWAILLFYYSKVRRDVSVLSLTLGSGVVLGTSILWRFLQGSDEPAALLILAIGIVTQSSMALGILRNLAPALPADPKAPAQETPDVKIWLGQLATEGLISSHQAEEMGVAMRVQNEAALPWFVRALTGFGAFVASVFLLLYLLLVGAVTSDNGVIFGLGMCAVASLLARVLKSELVSQACFALSLCGQLTAWLVFAFNHDSRAETALFMAGLELVLVAAYPSAFGRFLAANLSGLFLAQWLSLVAPTLALDVFVLLVAGLATFLWLRQHEILIGPLGPVHAPISLALVSLLFALLLSTITNTFHLPQIGLVGALGLTFFALLAAQRMEAPRPILIGLAAIGLICSSAPGVMAAVLVLSLGFYRRNQTLKGSAILFLLAFGSAYYYHLALSLLVKSVVLILTGLIFLLMAKATDQR